MGFVIAENVMFQSLEDEFVLVDLGSGSYYGARGVAGAIWELVTEGLLEEEIAVRIAERFEGDPKTISQDVSEFIAKLIDKGLVRRATT